MDVFFIIGTLLFSFFSFIFGAIFGYFSLYLFFPFILISIVISIIFINKSTKEKKFHAASLCSAILIIATISGVSIDTFKTRRTIKNIKLIKEYVVKNYAEKITEETSMEEIYQIIQSDEYLQSFPYAVGIENEGDRRLRIYYHDAWCYSDKEDVHLRPRP